MRLHDDRLKLRTFESEAERPTSRTPPRRRRSSPSSRAATTIQVMTQDVDEAPHVESTVVVAAAEGNQRRPSGTGCGTPSRTAYGDLRVTVDIQVSRR